MSENLNIQAGTAEKSIPPVAYALISNALQVYGVLCLGWHFFPILYLWWWEELILTVLGFLKLRRLRPILLKTESETEVLAGESAAKARFFLLFVYFIFVVVMAGFVFAPKGSYVENILTLIFRNTVFNLNLCLFIIVQAWIFWRDFYQNKDIKQVEWATLRQTFDLRSAVIHVGLLAGALLSFLLQRYNITQTEHAFMFGFMAIKTGVELWSAFKTKSNPLQ